MYISTSQIISSLERLKNLHPFFGFAFFGFKKIGIPVGKKGKTTYSSIRTNVLEPYFKPIDGYDGYFNPFKSTKNWVSARYDTTSLQRIIADTFSAAFIHKKGENGWGWQPTYVTTLQLLMETHQSSRISLLDFAVWIYRDDPNIPNEAEASHYLISKAIEEFGITESEFQALFLPLRNRSILLSPYAPDLSEVWDVFGWPTGFRDERGTALEYLNLINVGPAKDLGYFPKSRLNVITGDNSLGKTFLLDCCWWALTGNWPRHEAEPRRSDRIKVAEISYGIKSDAGPTLSVDAPYNRIEEFWQRPSEMHEGIGLYATHNGSFALWDSVGDIGESKELSEWFKHFVINRDEIWDGFSWEDRRSRKIQISNGLIRDWASWQQNEKKVPDVLKIFTRCLRDLSPPDGPPLRPGHLTTVTSDSREFPTIRMPYGDVPVIYASAGVQRIMALAYALLWHWQRHVSRCERANRPPFERMVVIIDEVESHLHPRWQRQIIPALLRTVRTFAPDLKVQFHISTHSPLALASMESEFSLERDAIHHMTLIDDDVDIEILEQYKHGTVNAWLESDIFGLGSARSVEAEEAINNAKSLQITRSPSKSAVLDAHRALVRALPDDDAFWVRWLSFAETHGAV